jgi:hypothetical protein
MWIGPDYAATASSWVGANPHVGFWRGPQKGCRYQSKGMQKKDSTHCQMRNTYMEFLHDGYMYPFCCSPTWHYYSLSSFPCLWIIVGTYIASGLSHHNCWYTKNPNLIRLVCRAAPRRTGAGQSKKNGDFFANESELRYRKILNYMPRQKAVAIFRWGSVCILQFRFFVHSLFCWCILQCMLEHVFIQNFFYYQTDFAEELWMFRFLYLVHSGRTIWVLCVPAIMIINSFVLLSSAITPCYKTRDLWTKILEVSFNCLLISSGFVYKR